ncbi:MAG: glutathione S-transferase domain-containing protein, partial [Myxococcales bacterium]|nr:glutathione S-transferase domain-containing protein [Myxococcales bacterium]
PEPPLMPSEIADRAVAHMRIAEFQQKLDPKNIFGSVVFGKKSREDIADRVAALEEELPRWDKYLEGRDYLANEFSLADIAVLPGLIHSELLGYPYHDKTPNLAAYLKRLKARPSVAESPFLRAVGGLFEQLGGTRVLAA